MACSCKGLGAASDINPLPVASAVKATVHLPFIAAQAGALCQQPTGVAPTSEQLQGCLLNSGALYAYSIERKWKMRAAAIGAIALIGGFMIARRIR